MCILLQNSELHIFLIILLYNQSLKKARNFFRKSAEFLEKFHIFWYSILRVTTFTNRKG